MKFPYDNQVVLISGAASGIGAALAQELAARGAHLALVDINTTGLNNLADTLPATGKTVSLHTLDLSDASAISTLPARIQEKHGRINMLVNNAGVALGGRFTGGTQADFDWVMAINFEAHIHMTRAFLPYLEREEHAHIVNVSSLFGLVGSAGQTAYCASKFALRGFSEALSIELAKGGSRTGVSTVHPGGVKTAIASSARLPDSVSEEEIKKHQQNFEKKLKLSPQKAAQIIANGAANRKKRIIVGRDAGFLSVVQRLFPAGYQNLMLKV